MCVTQGLIDGRTWAECGWINAGRVGEQVRDGENYFSPFLYFFPLLPQCREVTSSSAIWRECHATLPLPLPQTQMRFYFLCHALERKQFFPRWLMSVMWAGSRQRGSKGKIGIPFYIASDLPHAFIRPVQRRTAESRVSSPSVSTVIFIHLLADLSA